MPGEPEADAARVERFIKPVGTLLTERVDTLARIYASVLQSGTGYREDRLEYAREAVHDFLAMIDP